MFVKYDEYELMEFFDSEAISIFEKEAGMFIYTKTDINDFKLVMSLSVYENECEVSLSFKEQIVFESFLKNVEFLRSEGEFLRVHRTKENQDLLIFFKPNFMIKF